MHYETTIPMHNVSCQFLCSLKWRYAEMGVPPNHPFIVIDGIFQYKLSSCWGTSIYGNHMSFQNHRYNMVIPTALPDFKSFLKICMAPGQRKTPGWLLVSACEECCFTKQHGQPTKHHGDFTKQDVA